VKLTRRQLICLIPALAACDPASLSSPTSAGSWRPLSTAGAPTQSTDGAVVAWTGHEMLVWGGQTGALYDPTADTWRPMNAAGAPRSNTAVWAGRELFVWDAPAATGARYDPATDRWRPVASNLAPSPRLRPALVWTDRAVLLFGGFRPGPGSGRPEPPPIEPGGGLYHMATDTWRAITDSGLLPHPGYQVAWTGQEAIAWGGLSKADNIVPGVAYDPAADRWRRLPTAGESPRRTGHAVVWTGRLLLVLGGYGNTYSGQPIPPLDGGAYEPSTDRWLPMSSAGAPGTRRGHSAVWTGREAIVWGGEPFSTSGGTAPRHDGSAYDPATGRWRTLPTDGAPPRSGHAAVWTGQEMLVWGGYDGGPRSDGAAFRPA
jgi:hypothetical protein